MHRPMIVAPGGSHNKAITAARFGAEEVYMGVPFTSLRMRSNKLWDFSKLKKTVDAVHELGSKVFLTMNIFPRNVDIKIFEAVVEKVSDMGADAIIFSDPGTFHVLKKYMPNTHLHLSTQTTTMNYSAVQFWYDMGVKRVVLARELHIDEIREIKEKVPGIELEVFVQGAMCMTYSGRCLLGDYMGGRPGNKGECNHACRFNYNVYLEEPRRPGKFFQLEQGEDWGSFIMSSKDLSVINRLAEVLPYVDALKIEWRSKSEFYVWWMVKAYKHVRDAIIDGTPIDPEIQNLVNVIPHREYWDGFLFNKLKDYPDREEELTTDIPVEMKPVSERWNNEPTATTENTDLPQLAQDGTTTQATPWPLFARNYYGFVSEETLEYNEKKYFKTSPKETIRPGIQLRYLTPDSYGKLTITGILNEKGRELEKADCNTPNVYITTDYPLVWGEILYVNPSEAVQ